MKFAKLLCLQLVVMSLLVTPSVLAQSASTGALTGTVTDPTGASVPRATVTLTSVATNQSRTMTTGADGTYRFGLLEPGEYRVRFTAAGFKTSEVRAVNINVTDTPVLDRALEVGAQSEQITIEANVETLQTANSTLGTTVSGATIANLPLPARNFTSVLGMAAGVTVDATNGTSYGRGSMNMSVNGANPEKNNFQMDGVSINNAAGNNQAGDAGLYTGITIPNPDAIQEFKIQTSTYDASYGRNPGANVNVVTKSGSNQLHGTLFEFFRNERLNANDFFYNRDSLLSRTQKQVLKQNQYGGSIGGPIKKDKLFYFGSFQGTKQRNGIAPQGLTSATLYPVPDNREAADFSARLGSAMCGLPQQARGLAIACNGSNINPVAIALLRVKLPDGSYYIPGSGTPGVAQRLFSIPAKYTENQYIANADYVMSDKNTLQMKYMFSQNPFEYSLQGQLPGRVQTDRRSNTSAVLRLTTLVTPTVINQARISFQRIIQDGSDKVPYTPQQIGQKPLIDSTCCNGTTGGTYTQPPVLSMTGAFAVGGGLNPSFAPSNQTQYSDTLSWTKGTHTFRAGFEFENVRYPLVFGGLGRGNLSVNSFADLLIGRAGCPAADTTCSVGNPGNTTGVPTSSFNVCLFCVRSPVGGIIHNYHLENISAFFQDDWKISAKLTLNIGVRWERDGTLSDKYGNLTNFWASDLLSVPRPPSALNDLDARNTLGNNPAAFTGYVVPSNFDSRPISAGGHGPIPPGVRQFDGEFTAQNRVPLSNFGPRVGFAYQMNSRLVIRGGAGLFYDRVGINRMVHAVQEGRPYADTTALQHDIASLQSPFQDRPLALLPRYYNFNTFSGSNFDSPFYDKIHTPLVRQYNLGIQYEFIRNYVLEAAFVGGSGINIGDYSHVVNTAKLASPSNPVNGITTNTVQNASARVPYLGFQAIGLQQNGFDGVYNYNSLQVTVRKNFSHGVGFQMAYTWSKNLSNVFDSASANLNNPTDMAQQYGQTPYSRPHRLVLSYQYELPFKANGVVLNKVVGGWSASGLTLVQAGNPLTLLDARGGTIFGMPNSNTYEKGIGRAQLCPGVTYDQIATSGNVKDRLGLTSNAAAKKFFNVSAFCAPNAIGNGTDFGSAGVGIVRGPHQLNFDFSVNKMTRITERQNIQFRVDFFNIFNHAQFALPQSAGGQGLYGSNPTLLGVITGTSVNPRLIQLGLRYSF